MIWDLHCHLSGVDGATPRERIAQLMVYAGRMQVERLIFFMGFPWSRHPTPEDLRRQNDQVLEATGDWPGRTLAFAYVSPEHVQASLDEIERCVADGPMVGVKLWVAQKCRDRDVDAVIERCAELKAAVYQHTWIKTAGNDPGESTPADLAALAGRFPDVPLICGHTGGNWELGIRTIRPHRNVSIGTGGFDPTAGITEMAVRELGAERIVYGSDVGGRSFASQLAKVRGAAVPDEAKQLILGGNLKRMLAPILEAKGVRF